MVESEIFKEIGDVRARKAPWHEIARLVKELEYLPEIEDTGGHTRLQVASKLTGLSPNALRKMMRARAFLERFAQDEKSKHLWHQPIAQIEVLSRAHVLDSQRAGEIAALMRVKKISYRYILEEYQNIRERKRSGRQENSRRINPAGFKRKCHDILADGALEKIYHQIGVRNSSPRIRRWVGNHPFSSPDFLSTPTRPSIMSFNLEGGVDPSYRNILDNSQRGIIYKYNRINLDAFDCYIDSDDYDSTSASIRTRVVMAATESTFFDTYWILVPSDAMQAYEEGINRLSIPNVGIARVQMSGSELHITRIPQVNPSPDRRNMWTEWDKRYMP